MFCNNLGSLNDKDPGRFFSYLNKIKHNYISYHHCKWFILWFILYFCYLFCFILIPFTDKPRLNIPIPVIRTIPYHYIWCSAEGTPPINISLLNSSAVLASGMGNVKSKIHQQGNYTWFAKNEAGTDSREFSATLVGKILNVLSCSRIGSY